jgi:rhamnosyltransferase
MHSSTGGITNSVSILIRTYNSAGTLAEVLARLGAGPEDEILAVDSGSTDRTLEIAAQYQARIIPVEPPFNYSKSLNRGFAAARHDWVLVISSHCLPMDDQVLTVFRQAAAGFDEKVAVAYGECCLVKPPQTPTPPIQTTDKTAGPTRCQQIYGGNTLALYRRTHWQQQSFDEALPTGEDMAWFLNALERGWLVARVPAARVLYRTQASLRHMFRKGWLESRQIISLTGGRGLTLWQLGANWGSLLKKWKRKQIPTSTLLRLGTHVLGAYLSPKFFSPGKSKKR